jgi:nucleotide-binding universal stress UspA family protein
MFKPRKILFATDFSDESDEALQSVVSMAEQYNAKIFLLHVIEDIPLYMLDYYPYETDVETERSTFRRDALEKMDGQIGRLSLKSGMEIAKDVRFGRTVDEIIEEERDNDIDLLIVARHRRHHGWKILTPHITSRLAEKTLCEMLVK